VDAGSVQKATEDQGDDSWRWSTGLGMRYITPIGPIGLLYGFKLNPRPGESLGQLHISIGYTF
jgi:outer membrane protein insertion porin family